MSDHRSSLLLADTTDISPLISEARHSKSRDALCELVSAAVKSWKDTVTARETVSNVITGIDSGGRTRGNNNNTEQYPDNNDIRYMLRMTASNAYDPRFDNTDWLKGEVEMSGEAEYFLSGLKPYSKDWPFLAEHIGSEGEMLGQVTLMFHHQQSLGIRGPHPELVGETSIYTREFDERIRGFLNGKNSRLNTTAFDDEIRSRKTGIWYPWTCSVLLDDRGTVSAGRYVTPATTEFTDLNVRHLVAYSALL
jgi:hypothetical protein